MSIYTNDNVNDSFRKEPDEGKPHVRNSVRGAPTRPGKKRYIILRKCVLKELFTYIACSDKNNLKAKADLLIECCNSALQQKVSDTIKFILGISYD